MPEPTDPTALARDLAARRVASRLARRDTTVFVPEGSPGAAQAAIASRLGWLDAPAAMSARLEDVAALAAEARAEGLDTAVVLGMGGSSLSAEVLRDAGGGGAPARLRVLDTTDARAIALATAAVDPARTLFLVASKSGTTLEVAALERHFWTVVSAARGSAAGRHFVAITDPGTALVDLAAARGYRRVFLNPADIGGRFSALSLFGLVPAALLGMDAGALLDAGAAMADACREDDADNPAVTLGAFLAAHAAAGRDKLTLAFTDRLAPLGPWIEQLVAESTGKGGRGVLPIVDEPRGPAAEYGADRAFVVAGHERDPALAGFAGAIAAAGHPVLRLADAGAGTGLGREFYRWEMATAIAGAALGVNPFDEPDVRGAKARTQELLDAHARSGSVPIDPPWDEASAPPVRWRVHHGRPAPAPGRFVAVLDYLPADPERAALASAARATLRRRAGAATTWGAGPRYLHSTGQYHKGGPNTGAFLLLTAETAEDLPVPGLPYSFPVLNRAQAAGDFNALVAAGRTVVHGHLEAGADAGAAVASLMDRLLDVAGIGPARGR